ncbi:S24 family peptidase [Cetobacterium somerae]|uniref:S24 family peptidase n=1 Tax=Cetobacterium sp. NK01 TaxID=2993530 RepID=UPI0021165D26|nr:S24 family peptidase [Cetobacterium sp. NK01]MCQ8213059.1 S24 family peptidase [Cetobacterium sp. NK01]
MKTKFGSYLEKLMIKNNYTLEYIAKQTESSLSVVGHYRKGIRIPKDDFVERFIEKFIKTDKEADEIRYIVAYDRTPDLIKRKLDANLNTNDQKKAEIIKLPVLGKAAAGLGHVNFEDNTRMEVLASIPATEVPRDAFMVEVTGDSMFPTLSDGDLVIINPLKKHMQNIDGKVCVLSYHDQTYIKRVKINKNEIRLISDNSDKKQYSDIVIIGEELEYLKCHGSVIESRRKH